MKKTPDSHDNDRKHSKFGAPAQQPGVKRPDPSQQHATAAKPDGKFADRSDNKPGNKSGAKSTGKLPTPTHPPA